MDYLKQRGFYPTGKFVIHREGPDGFLTCISSRDPENIFRWSDGTMSAIQFPSEEFATTLATLIADDQNFSLEVMEFYHSDSNEALRIIAKIEPKTRRS